MTYKAVIFDLDGTLLNTLEDIADSANSVLSRFGFPQHGLESYKYFIGNGLEQLVKRTIPKEKRTKAIVSQCIAAMREEYSKRWADKTRPYTGIPDLLTKLNDFGIKLAILSNKPDDFTKLMVAKFFPHHHFEVVVGSRPSVPKKPNPKAAIEIAGILEIRPQEILLLGDSSIDMETANAAGIYPVGALWGFRTAEELLASGAKMLMEKPNDLSKIL